MNCSNTFSSKSFKFQFKMVQDHQDIKCLQNQLKSPSPDVIRSLNLNGIYTLHFST